MLVVNLLGEPCAGKSTAALYITAKLKEQGYNVEYIPEFAKQKVYEDNNLALQCQEYIFGSQSYMLASLEGKVNIVIVDSPLILSAIYNTENGSKFHLPSDYFNEIVMSAYNRYDNLTFFLLREHEYVMDGRVHNEMDAKRINKKIITFCKVNNIQIYEHRSIENNYNIIVEQIIDYFNDRKEN